MVCCAQSDTPHTPVSSLYIVRTAEQLQGPHVTTYRLVEWAQVRGRWIIPDIGYYDNGTGRLQDLFTAAGYIFVEKPRLEFSNEIYFSQLTGPDGHGARALWIWPVVDAKLTHKLDMEAVVYPTVPLNKAAHAGFDVDRIKFEYYVLPHLRVGPGYASSFCQHTWTDKPLVTATFLTHAGEYEFWVQRIQGGAQLQFRYALSHRER